MEIPHDDNDVDCPFMDGQDDEYSVKYHEMLKQYEAVKMDNARMLNNMCQIKKIICKFQKQRRILIKRLEKHKDDFRNVKFPLFLEREEKEQVKTNCLSNNSCSHKEVSSSCKPKRKVNANDSSGQGSIKTQPKKPINPYLIFCQENRALFQEKHQQEHNSDMSHQELTKVLAQNWHELSASDKQIYYRLYETEKERYESQMKAYNASSKDHQDDQKVKK